MKINKYFPFAFIYFFINSLGLPFGLTYTAILSPLFYWWIITERKKELLTPFFVCLAPFFIIHTFLGIDAKTYIFSVLNYTAVYIFCQAFYTFLGKAKDIEKVFEKLLIVNFLFCLLALVFYFTPYSSLLWMEQTITDGLDNFKRLKLFTYEASYYATLFTPLFFFFFMQIVLRQNKMNSWLLFLLLFLPYILSFSIGVIACLLLSLIIVYLIYFNRLMQKKRVVNLFVLTVLLSASVIVVLVLFVPQNSLFIRLQNVFSGKDTSGNGRTFESFILAMKMLELKSHTWGIGAGQIKILGTTIIKDYYLYPIDYNNIAIPNATAETLAIFGYVGLSLRLLAELFLFFYTRVWTNYYRLLMFIFIFLYQFTGSFITNVGEYVIWILAFTNAFPAFDVRKTTAPVHYIKNT